MGLDWDTLIDNVRAGVCIPFLGAGACGGVLPRADELSTELLAPASAPKPFPFSGAQANLAKVTQYLAAVGGDALKVKRKVAALIENGVDRVRRKEVQLPAIHTTLARLKLPTYFTTNYDCLLEMALEAQVPPRTARSEICRWSRMLLDEEESCFDSGSYLDDPQRPLVFHLHGRSDRPDSIVVTEDDYLDFLLNVSRDVAGTPATKDARTVLPPPLRKLIKRHPLLFIGYGLTDINLLVILRGLLRSVDLSDRVQRVAVHLDLEQELATQNNAQEVRQRIERYFAWTLNVDVFWGTADELARKLEESFP